MNEWIDIKDQKPEDGQKVICYLPENYQYLPGKTGEKRFEPILILRFSSFFFKEGTEKFYKYGPHFWLGEGLSNHYFPDVSHWMLMPKGPEKDEDGSQE